MCRSIVTLRGTDPVSDEEIHAAALQFVRKISGFRQPSQANAEAFDTAVAEIAGSARRLLDRLPATRPRPAPSRRADRGAGTRS
ncbi:MAG TPA: DUF2277 domain-containing protein [Acidimicrobiales bacterium]|jgi:hypothetical protein|nr:DUF2277 domain-containing protein [Acidimicrobiales bacterium]